MKIVGLQDLKNTDRQVECPKGGFTSYRFLLESDGMGYTLTKTDIPKSKPQMWHYKNHLETCLCIKGHGIVTDLKTGQSFTIKAGVAYVLDNHDKHMFEALEDTTLICVFNPPLTGKEVHQEDGSYVLKESK